MTKVSKIRAGHVICDITPSIDMIVKKTCYAVVDAAGKVVKMETGRYAIFALKQAAQDVSNKLNAAA